MDEIYNTNKPIPWIYDHWKHNNIYCYFCFIEVIYSVANHSLLYLYLNGINPDKSLWVLSEMKTRLISINILQIPLRIYDIYTDDARCDIGIRSRLRLEQLVISHFVHQYIIYCLPMSYQSLMCNCYRQIQFQRTL